jgi:maltose/moltooligosaccharide transporter
MSTTSAALPESPGTVGAKIFKVGTLQYTQRQLYILFFWLMWNDFTVMLLEQPIAFGKFLQLNHGATNAEIGVFTTISGLLTIWINPVFSVWSDRTRTRWGRRRPFLLIATPPLAFFIAITPYMPTLYHYLLRYPSVASFFHRLPMNGAVLMLGLCIIATQVFNMIIMALFSYLYWDVVPQEVLGRWFAMVRIVGALSTFVWSFFLFGLGDHHMKALCVGIALFCLTVYLLSIWKAKEGGYPPVDKHEKGGLIAPVRAYFVECFSDPFYLWVFAAFLIAGIASASNDYQRFYLYYDLHFSYDTIGKWSATPQLVSILLGYFFGATADRLHPMRLFAPTFFIWGLICVGSYFFIVDRWSYFFWTTLTQVIIFANGVTYGALLPQIYPREKFGQFCSANQLCGSLAGALLAAPIGYLFDYLHSYRYSYLFAAFFLFAGSAMFVKVRRNFDKRHGHVPQPHAG